VDAYVDYRTVVFADDACEAAYLARENADDYKWEEDGAIEFDARGYVALDDDGDEIEKSRCGYFG
jgi:hypothetical protein